MSVDSITRDLQARAEAAEAEVQRLREALERIARMPWPTGDWGKRQQEAWEAATNVTQIARAALNPEECE